MRNNRGDGDGVLCVRADSGSHETIFRPNFLSDRGAEHCSLGLADVDPKRKSVFSSDLDAFRRTFCSTDLYFDYRHAVIATHLCTNWFAIAAPERVPLERTHRNAHDGADHCLSDNDSFHGLSDSNTNYRQHLESHRGHHRVAYSFSFH
jgi:hypothetical protein